MALSFKNIADVSTKITLSDSDTIMIIENGELKKIPASALLSNMSTGIRITVPEKQPAN